MLVLYLPASWFASMLPPQVRCAELGGSLWQGECLGLDVPGREARRCHLESRARQRAHRAALAGDVDVRGSALSARADLDISFNGSGELRNVTARFPLDPAFVAQFPRDQRGNIVADLKRVVLADGPALAHAAGHHRTARLPPGGRESAGARLLPS